jgi:hypothetical protein
VIGKGKKRESQKKEKQSKKGKEKSEKEPICFVPDSAPCRASPADRPSLLVCLASKKRQ